MAKYGSLCLIAYGIGISPFWRSNTLPAPAPLSLRITIRASFSPPILSTQRFPLTITYFRLMLHHPFLVYLNIAHSPPRNWPWPAAGATPRLNSLPFTLRGPEATQRSSFPVVGKVNAPRPHCQAPTQGTRPPPYESLLRRATPARNQTAMAPFAFSNGLL